MATQSRVSSRLIKKERQRLTKQIIWFSALSVLLMLFFLFVVLPVFVRVVNGIINTNPINNDNEAVFIQAPSLDAPPAFVAKSNLQVTGYAEKQAEVIFIVNGSEDVTVSAGDDGRFEAALDLSEGENVISAYARIDQDKESPVSRQHLVVLDTEPPVIELISPEDGKTFNIKDQTLTVEGSTDPEAKVYLNGRLIFPSSEGVFSSKYQLQSGDQIITVKAVDQAGNEAEVVRQIKAE